MTLLRIVCFLWFFSCVLAAKFTLQGIVRDFKDDHPDFENYNTGLRRNLVEHTIRTPSRKPKYNATTGAYWESVNDRVITSEATFLQWHQNVSGVNQAMFLDIELSNEGNADKNIYTYSNPFFFPIDNLLYGNQGNAHNYHFTFEIHGRFPYRGNEVFKFTGDDDVWAFINDKLVIDLGGVHSAASDEIHLDTLGLTPGNHYRFDFFFAERHTHSSNFKIETTMQIYCAYHDHCGVCEGDGQSCCKCDDRKPCTLDSCEVMNGTCIHKPIVCDDNNLCTSDTCVNGQCTYSAIPCDDGNSCTDSVCRPSTGCSHTPMNCDDGDSCTYDPPCSNGVCPKPIELDCCGTVCGSLDPCLPSQCDPDNIGECITIPVDCDDGNPCTDDTCQNVDGVAVCVYTAHRCDDGNPCTDDYCDVTEGRCLTTPRVCDDNSKCTKDRCDNSRGCVFEPVDCSDGNFCTDFTCEPNVGCLTYNKSCVVDYPDCQVGICNNERSECTVEDLPDRNEALCGFLMLDPGVKGAVLSAGALVGIILGAVGVAAIITAISSRKAYTYYMKRAAVMNGANDNPLYEDDGNTGENPFYAEPGAEMDTIVE